jgi:phenylacetic acid degradation operon negative regulatory protein
MSQRRNARPLSARSVLASVLLGTEPPRLPTPLLVRTGELFGVAEGTVRTALSRMASAGEVVAEDGGYRLTGRLVERQRRQAASRRAEVRRWDGTWELMTIDGSGARSAADRAALRDALTARRLAELREGVWARPDNLDPDRSPDAARLVEQWCTQWRGASPAPSPDVEALFELSAWSAEAASLHRSMDRLLPPLERGDTRALSEGFVVSASVLRLFQHDPLLPPELLPRSWPGPKLREQYDRYDAAYRSTLRAWFQRES